MARTGGYPTAPHSEVGLLGFRGSSQVLLFPVKPSPLPCTLCHSFYCCYCLFSYVLADSSNEQIPDKNSKLFLPQPMILTFCASSSLHPTQASERCGFRESTTGRSITPKPQQAGIAQSLRTQFQTAASVVTLKKYFGPYLYKKLFSQPSWKLWALSCPSCMAHCDCLLPALIKRHLFWYPLLSSMSPVYEQASCHSQAADQLQIPTPKKVLKIFPLTFNGPHHHMGETKKKNALNKPTNKKSNTYWMQEGAVIKSSYTLAFSALLTPRERWKSWERSAMDHEDK